jgi:hypothetical protein
MHKGNGKRETDIPLQQMAELKVLQIYRTGKYRVQYFVSSSS